jgi:hypothetical protein
MAATNKVTAAVAGHFFCRLGRVFSVGAPQFGHFSALLLISLPQSSQGTSELWKISLPFSHQLPASKML